MGQMLITLAQRECVRRSISQRVENIRCICDDNFVCVKSKAFSQNVGYDVNRFYIHGNQGLTDSMHGVCVVLSMVCAVLTSEALTMSINRRSTFPFIHLRPGFSNTHGTLLDQFLRRGSYIATSIYIKLN